MRKTLTRDVFVRCRGDVDDRVLMEAILPLLQGLASSPDVRPVLHRRFDMRRWFLSQVSCRPLASSGTPRVWSQLLHLLYEAVPL